MIVALAAIVALVSGAIVIALAIGPGTPQPLASVETAFEQVDYSDMPPVSHFTARDGAVLSYRAYPADQARIAILVHGSSGTSAGMHAVARAVHARGWTVYALAMRGHDHTGRSGDIDAIGQLDDDLADFVKRLPAASRKVLLGFSSGGGFVSRIGGEPMANAFSRFVLVSPQPPARSGLMRPNAGGWVSVALPRIIALELLSSIGFHRFEGLTTLAFAVAPEHRDAQTASYSYRMMRNFGPTNEWLDDLKRAPAPVAVLIGGDDELFYPEKFAPTLKPIRPDLSLTTIPGLGHMAMTTDPKALAAIVKAVTD